MDISLHVNSSFDETHALTLFTLNKWKTGLKPKLLMDALRNSHSLIVAYNDYKLVGLGNAISDGHMIVYYPFLLVHPQFQRQGIGTLIVKEMGRIYKGFHQQRLAADGLAVDFYLKNGFSLADDTKSMWLKD